MNESRKRLKFSMKLLNLKQKDFARVIGVSEQLVSHMVRGRRGIARRFKEAVEQKTGISARWITGESDLIFSDFKKGLEIMCNRSVLSQPELYFLCFMIQRAHSRFFYFQTRKAFVTAMLDAIMYLSERNGFSVEEYLLRLKEKFEKDSVVPCTVSEVAAEQLLMLLKKTELTQEEEEYISGLLLPWGLYVCRAGIFCDEKKCFPCSSVSIPVEAVTEEQEVSIKPTAFISGSVGIGVLPGIKRSTVNLFNGKVSLLLTPEELFSMLCVCMDVDVEVVKILDFGMRKNRDRNTVELCKNPLSLEFSLKEFEDLSEVTYQIVKQKGVYHHLCRAFINRYGFI